MASADFDASDLYTFLGQFQGRRSGDFYRLTGEDGPFVAASGPYYAPEILLPEPRAPSPARTERDVMSLASSATPRSAVFDSLDSYSAYSTSTAPPRRGHEPPHRQRAPVPDAPVSWLPCEFRRLSGCGANFALDDVEPWVEHIIAEHLKRNFPKHSICWFCDQGEFSAASELQEDEEKAYRRRMHHIAEHFRNGKTALDIRWDFHFLDHVHNQCLIDEHVFQWATRQSELRPPRGMTFANHARAGRRRGEAYEYSERRRGHARRRDGSRPARVRRDVE
ncbi:Uncharacterized protein TCAP_06151 [Tolypocladium capitatum]|uniref:Uncharacterized protein n=1 Tax=Tolypocladium capitatum TaxID=45235 RepID=A0A2K3Q8X2_9HYPO|nr:Uncharacterized protein TCAP_06151 [Tolypocladium capitatum]